MRLNSLVFSCTLLVVCDYVTRVHCTRGVKLYPDEEPSIEQVRNNYRMVFADRSLFQLGAAGLVKSSEISDELLEDERGPDGNFLQGKLTFNSSEFIRKLNTIKFYVPLEETTAKQVYDNPQDVELARGQQVDQELCGLHLDYMLFMLKKHMRSIVGSTDMSLFTIMNTYGTPGFGISLGNTLFPGIYHTCQNTKLSVIKNDLDQINKRTSDKYFELAARKAVKERDWFPSLKALWSYVGPFLTFPNENSAIPLNKFEDKFQALPMRYCMLGINWPTWANTSHNRRNLVFRSGICLPDTCDSSSLTLYNDKIKQLFDSQVTDYYSGYHIEHLYCLPDEKSELRNPFNYTSTSIFIVFNIIWLSWTLFATVVGTLIRQGRINRDNPYEFGGIKFLNKFCMIENFNCYLGNKRIRAEGCEKNKSTSEQQEQKEQNNRVDLEPLEGFKVTSSIAVIISHATMVEFANNWNTTDGHYLISKSWLSMLIFICPAIVNNFFVVTGLLTSYSLFQVPRSTLLNIKFWFSFVLYRYIRIVPIWFFVHWFLKSYFRFIGSGPFWDYGTSHTSWSKVCQEESWLTVLLPMTNFKSPSETCNGVAWYLANDVQFSIITPLIITLFLIKPIIGYITTAGLILGIMFAHIKYYLDFTVDPRAGVDANLMILSRVTDENSSGYVNPQYRCIAHLLGLAAGHLLNQYNNGKIKNWPKSFVRGGKLFIGLVVYLLCAMPFITSLAPSGKGQFLRYFGAIAEGSIHGVSSLAATVFILLLCTRHMNLFGYFFSLRFFRPVANTLMSSLLLHIPLIFYHSGVARSLPELTIYTYITTTLVWCVEAYILAIPFFILYESPLRRILTAILISFFSHKTPEIRNLSYQVKKSKSN